MASVSPTRPSRRAAARHARVIDSSDAEDDQSAPQQSIEADSEEEFTPAPQRTARRTARRKTTDVSDTRTPRTATRTRRTRTGDSVEASQIFSPAESMPPEPISPIKAPSPKKRQTLRQKRKSRVSVSVAPDLTDVPELPPPLPTPQPSASPEPMVERHSTPLADITEMAVNERTPVPSPRKDEAWPTIPEKPMDIVVRTRATTTLPPSSQEPTAPRSRTVITHLVLTNFKSYAGRQEVGPFHASFSSVVGPNGSGKSNVIDSLLFVFGFRASKMRQGKISALIHNSAAYPDLDHCEVSVHFQEVRDLPNGQHEVIPDSTLIISRRAFKNNASKYYINNTESNFTAVTTLLRDRGVDLDHKRFLILQGEVESIAQMKPKAASEHDDGLLEYLEDIIGTSRYKAGIEESAAATETLNEVCHEKQGRVAHVEKERDALEDKKEKALEFVRDENELASKQAALWQVFVGDCEDNIGVMQEAVGQMQGQLEEELLKHQGNEEEIKKLEKRYKAGSKEYDQLQKQTEAVIKEVAKLDKETVKFEEKKKFLSGKQKKLEKLLQSSKSAIAEADTSTKQCTDDIARNTGQIEELQHEMQREEQELAKIRDSLKGKTQGISDQIAAKQKSLEPWNEKINEKQSAIAVAQSELDILREKDNAGAKSIEEVQAKIAAFEESKESRAAELEECKTQKRQVEKDVQKVQTEVDELAKKEPAIRSKVSGARQKADEARASLSATQTQGNVLTGLMRLKESGRIDGFHGRLGNLGAIDQKYDVAISTACPSLDNLVVDSVEVGQQCIDYLRKNNLGRANFILLDRLPKRDLSAIETPENVPRLFDLVKSKHDRFLPAFYSVLQNTLVAKDLEQANRIAYGAKRWRVVTLDGQLIDKSGTMSGGGTRVAKGGMSSKLAADVSKDQVAKLEVDRDALEQTYADLQRQQRDADAALRALKDQIPQLETKAQKLALELGSFDRNIADAQRRIQELGAEQGTTKSDKSRIAALEKSIAGLEKEVAKVHAETAGVEEEIKVLQDKIMEIGGVKLRGQKAKVDGLKEQIDTLTEEMSTAEVAKAKAEKQKTKHEKAYAEAAAELDGLAEELEKADQAMRDQNRDASGSRQQAEEAQEALETKKEELQALKSELDAKTAELNETRGIEIDMRNQLEENQKTLAENQKRLRHWQDKLSKLTIQNISDLGEEQEADALPTYTKDELQDMDKNALKAEIAALEEKTQNTNVELGVLAEYRRRVEEHTSRSADLAAAVADRDAAKKRCDDLRRLRLEGFMEGFSTISLRLKEMYQMITMGGNAELELVDSLDPFSEGILFSVMPPKKSWKNISNLSGGEKTLSSLALVFALHHYKPTPLYVMDEIDAALDFRNVSIVASYIKERTKNAQFIVISLRNNMFELASRLVGVYKVNHMTKSVTIENRDYIVDRA
ncbi:Structural maintenance of chromosomes protein 4 [Coniosporium apollinis]|uniref:Structural maintenance of chromosomes protein n=1 Tax=Coniosporium apollinis TaxID=61459 RepID=A0ABQ9NJM3_9PEZI|nr:Structural maintenance of chromosomes protein 4 [Coniosporium apollinis]